MTRNTKPPKHEEIAATEPAPMDAWKPRTSGAMAKPELEASIADTDPAPDPDVTQGGAHPAEHVPELLNAVNERVETIAEDYAVSKADAIERAHARKTGKAEVWCARCNKAVDNVETRVDTATMKMQSEAFCHGECAEIRVSDEDVFNGRRIIAFTPLKVDAAAATPQLVEMAGKMTPAEAAMFKAWLVEKGKGN